MGFIGLVGQIGKLLSKPSLIAAVLGSGGAIYLGGGIKEALIAFGVVRASIAAGAVVVANVRQTVPFTARKHAIIVPAFFEVCLGETSFLEYVKAATLEGRVEPKAGHDHIFVQNIADKIIAVLQTGKGGGHQKHLKWFRWELVVVNNKEANAFVLPGGKIVVHTGLLDLLKRQQDMVAMVMAHEVAHALARHGMERMGMGWMFALLIQAITAALLRRDPAAAAARRSTAGPRRRAGAADEEDELSEEAKKALQLGSKYFQLLVALPFSRRHEAEADLIGLKLMALAGYNPAMAPETFRLLEEHQQQSSGTGGSQHPTQLSMQRLGCTHPSGDTRIKLLNQELASMKGTRGGDGLEKVFTPLSYLMM